MDTYVPLRVGALLFYYCAVSDTSPRASHRDVQLIFAK